MQINKEADFVLRANKVIHPPVRTDGLELYYDTKGKKNTDTYKNKLLDMSGNGRHGELHNFSYKNLSGYQEDSELVFDGIEDKLVLGDVEKPEIISATKNLFDPQKEIVATQGSYTLSWEVNLKPNTSYTVSTNAPRSNGIDVFFDNKDIRPSSATNGVRNTAPRTLTTDSSGVVWVSTRQTGDTGAVTNIDNVRSGEFWIQLEEGSTATPYAPYIPSIRGTYQINNNIISYDGDTVRWVKDRKVMERKGINLVRNQESRWIGINGSVVFNSGRIVSEGDGSLSYPQVRQELKLTEGNKYLSIVEARVLNSECSLLRLSQRTFSAEVIKEVPNPTKNVWYELMGIQTAMNLSRGIAVYHRYGDEKTSVGKKMEIRNTQVIDLTSTFGAGNEPTLEEIQAEPDKWQWLPNPLDLVGAEELKGNILGDMEDIIDDHTRDEQSGVEVFTNKADDSLVMVEIDGKSYQHIIKENPNLMTFTRFEEGFSGHWRGLTPTIVEDSYFGRVAEIDARSMTGPFQPANYMVSGKEYTVSVYAKSDTEDFSFYIAVDGSGIQLAQKFTIGTEWQKISATFTNTTSNKNIRFYGLGKFYIARPKTEEGNQATVNSPSPDYPIEIHSLNDFDVVSSVGKKNLSSKDGWYAGSSINPVKTDNGFIITRAEGLIYSDVRVRGRDLDIKEETDYTLSFKVRKLDGELSNIGGHTHPNFRASWNIYINGEEILGGNYAVPPIYEPLNNGEWHEVVAFLRSEKSISDTGLLYIQPNRQAYRDSVVEIKDIKLEEGHLATPYTPSPEEVGDENHPLIDKINLLLSEPLRSVGDVKDRLFRDSDGLWKVERNIYSQLLDGSEIWGPMTNLNDNDFMGFHFYTGINRTGTYSSVMSSHFTQGGGDIAPVNRFSEERNLMGIQLVNGQVKIIINGNILPSKDINGFRNWLKNNNVRIQYIKSDSSIENLDEELQDKLNNTRSFQDSNYVYTVINETDGLLGHISENLKPQIHTEFLSKDHYKESRTVNNLLIWNRALEDEELLNQNKLFHERFNMRSNTIKGEPITQTINLTQGGYVANTLSLEYTIEI